MSATLTDWARGYAKQSLSDLDAREALVRARIVKCHRLHFLQMAAEKACKAYLIAGGKKVKKRHDVVEKYLPQLARHFYSLENQNNNIAQWELSQIKALAREIEALAPACDHGDSRRDNSEYPWENAQRRVVVPCEYSFARIDDGNRTIVRLIRLIRRAAESYSA
jgi:hypothetical protein